MWLSQIMLWSSLWTLQLSHMNHSWSKKHLLVADCPMTLWSSALAQLCFGALVNFYTLPPNMALWVVASMLSSNKAGHRWTYKFTLYVSYISQVPMTNHAAAPEPKCMEVLQHIHTLLNHCLHSEMEGLAGPKPSSQYKDMNVHGHEYIAPTVCYGMGGNFKNAGCWYITISIFISLPLFTRYQLILSHPHSAQSSIIQRRVFPASILDFSQKGPVLLWWKNSRSCSYFTVWQAPSGGQHCILNSRPLPSISLILAQILLQMSLLRLNNPHLWASSFLVNPMARGMLSPWLQLQSARRANMIICISNPQLTVP